MILSSISKETQDKVKLAKKFIQDKYQSLLVKEKQEQQNWKKIVQLMTKNNLSQNQKKQIQKQLHSHKQIEKRLMRQKDSLKNYELYDIIGKGAFGDVRIAKNKSTNEIVAIKRIQKQRLIEKKQISSVYLQRQLMIKNENSKFLVKLSSTFQDKKYVYLVMEYIPGGDLLHLLIQKDIFTEEQTRFYIAQLILALEEIHSKNYIHRDIKPDNILINNDGHIKISDFGLSKYIQKDVYSVKKDINSDSKKNLNKKTKMNNNSSQKQNKKLNHLRNINLVRQRAVRKFSKVGTPDYISPQVLIADQYDFSIDIWSVGVIMFQCLFGYPPFADDDSKEVCQKVINWQQYLQFPSDINVSFQAKLLILGMINQRQKRLKIQEIKNHPFFKNLNWKQLKNSKAPMIPNLNHELDIGNFQKYEQQNWQSNQNQQEQTQFHPLEQNNFLKKTTHCEKSQVVKKRCCSVDFSFAGFQYTRINVQPFQSIQNQIKRYKSTNKIKVDSKLNSIHKTIQIVKKPVKRFNTFQDVNSISNKTQIKNNLQNKGTPKYMIKKSNSNKNYLLDLNKTAHTFGLVNSSLANQDKKMKQNKMIKIKKVGQLTGSNKFIKQQNNQKRKFA